jgi:epoxyqueuosine reductase
MSDIAAQIRRLSAEAGFDRVGIARAEKLELEDARVREWLGRGFHATMAWMEREPEKRSDPRLIFPEARSVVVFLHNYYTPHRHSSPGKISRYAWGDDYHIVLREEMGTVLSGLQAIDPDIRGKICVDTTPIMEKPWAVRAGLGWIGKHSNLITRDIGSWVFIGVLLLNIEVEPDPPFAEEHCGTCTACLDACPTGAIVEPFIVDSARCISHATIELRDEDLPDAVAENIDGWIYGCDVCQDVCPWNRFETPTAEARFEPRNNETSLDPAIISNMTHEEYVERFRGSAIKRAKLTGLKRNAKYIRGATDDHDQEN